MAIEYNVHLYANAECQLCLFFNICMHVRMNMLLNIPCTWLALKKDMDLPADQISSLESTKVHVGRYLDLRSNIRNLGADPTLYQLDYQLGSFIRWLLDGDFSPCDSYDRPATIDQPFLLYGSICRYRTRPRELFDFQTH